MDIFEKVSKDIIAAMKAKDKMRLEALRNVKKFFIEAKTAPGANDTLDRFIVSFLSLSDNFRNYFLHIKRRTAADFSSYGCSSFLFIVLPIYLFFIRYKINRP